MSLRRSPAPRRSAGRCAAARPPGSARGAGGSRPAPPSTCSPVSASGNGVSARAFNARARTVRNWPDSPASNPGGVKRSQRGSDNRSATAASINPVRAQNRSSSHTAVRIALTVDPDRARPARAGVDLEPVLEPGQLRQLDPSPVHPLRLRTSPGTAPPARHRPGSCAGTAPRPAGSAGTRSPPGAPPTQRRAPPTTRCRRAATPPARPGTRVDQLGHVANVAAGTDRVPDTRQARARPPPKPTSLTR